MEIREQTYIINNCKDFISSHIFECCQCFRWKKQEDGSFTGIFQNSVINVKQEKDKIIFNGMCDGNIEEIIDTYFDLETDYTKIKSELSKVDEYLKQSIEFGSGIRILNQDLWEVIISFIISANNNIPRIQKIIERLSMKYGNKIIWNNKTYYTFPSKEQLAKASIEDLRNLGLGFRDKYVYETTRKILQGEVNLEDLQNIEDTDKVRNILESLPRSRTQSS